jgi:Ring finger domain
VELSRWEVVDKPNDELPKGVVATDIEKEHMREISKDERDVALLNEHPSTTPEPVTQTADLEHTLMQSDNAKIPEISPEAIGRETCPICIVDFQEGDDLRVLPCEGKHRFHQECVDQWLLELSSSCPICREGAYFFVAQSLYGVETQSAFFPM